MKIAEIVVRPEINVIDEKDIPSVIAKLDAERKECVADNFDQAVRLADFIGTVEFYFPPPKP